MKKQIISILVAFVMVLTMLPIMAFADGDPVYVAKIGEQEYTTLQNAIDAAKEANPTDGKVTITLLADCSGDGIVVPEGKFSEGTKKLVLDLNGKTYTVAGNLVGSAGTQTNGFQLLKGNDIEIKNGKITNNDQVTGTVDECRILIQNYSDLTLDHVVLDGTNQKETRPNRVPYVLSDNNGTTNIIGSKIIATTGGIAFDSCKYGSYTPPIVTVSGDSIINGKIEVTGGNLELTNGTYTDVVTACNYAKGDIKIRLEENVDVSSQIEIKNHLITDSASEQSVEIRDIAIDLNGHTVEYKGTETLKSGVILIHNGARLTIDDTSGGGIIKSGDKAYAAVAMTKSGDNVYNPAILIVNNGTLEGFYYGITGNGNRNNTEIIINGGTVRGNKTDDSTGIYHPQAGSLTINGGTIEGATGIYVKSGDVQTSVNGGTIKGIGIKADYQTKGDGFDSTGDGLVFENCGYPGGTPTGLISGGTFESTNGKAVASYAKEGHTPITEFVKGGTFSDLSAVEYATNGAVIALSNDVNITSQLEITNVAITLDLNGHKVEYTGGTLNSGVILVHNGAELTIKDTAGNGSIKSGNNAYAAVSMTKAGDDPANPAVLVVEGGTLEGKYYGIVGNGDRHNTEITINGGTIKGTNDNDCLGIYHPQDGKLTVKGGDIIGYNSAIEMRAGTLKIEGGTFTSTATAFSCDANGNGNTTTGSAIAIAQHNTKKNINVAISGGTFNGIKAFNESNPQENDPAPQVSLSITGGTFNGDISVADTQKFIKGGTFKNDPSSFLANNYKVTGAGPYTVSYDPPYTPPAPPAPVTPPTPVEDPVVKAEEDNVVVAPKAEEKDGEVKAEISEENLEEAIALSEKNESESIVIAPKTEDAKKVEIALPTEAVKEVASNTAVALIVETEEASISIPNETLGEIVEAAEDEEIVIKVEKAEEKDIPAELSEEVPEVEKAEDLIVVNVTITSGEKVISTFGGKSLEVHVPVDTKKFEEGKTYAAYIISADGSVEKTIATIKNGKAVVVTTHFSTIVVTGEEKCIFEDVEKDTYYYDAVLWAVQNGITDGVDTTHFDPNGIASRAQMVTFLWRAAGCPEPATTECAFTDIVEDSYYYEAVLWAVGKGITDGTSETTFDPSATVSRSQAVTFMARMCGVKDDDTGYAHPFTDVEEGSFYNNAVAWAYENKVTDGTSETTFEPTNDCLRGQVVTYLYRYFGK